MKPKVENGEVMKEFEKITNEMVGVDYGLSDADWEIITDFITNALNKQRKLLEKDCPCKPIHSATCSRYGVGKTLENYNKSKLPTPNEGEKI